MATEATVTDLDSRRPAPTRGGGRRCGKPVDNSLDAPKVASNANTLCAYISVLERSAVELGPGPVQRRPAFRPARLTCLVRSR
jgi:hypothetical protein